MSTLEKVISPVTCLAGKSGRSDIQLCTVFQFTAENRKTGHGGIPG